MSAFDAKIEAMKLKKSFLGGYDREGVYLFLRELCALHQEELNNMEQQREDLAAENARLDAELTAQSEENQTLKAQIAEEQFFHNEYNARFQVLADAVALLNEGKEGIMDHARNDATAILDQANEQLNRVKQECGFQQRRRDAIINKISGATKKFDDSMEKLRSNLYAILGEVDAARVETTEENSDREARKDDGDDDASSL